MTDKLAADMLEKARRRAEFQDDGPISIAAYAVEINRDEGFLVDGIKAGNPTKIQIVSLVSREPVHIRAIYNSDSIDWQTCDKIPELKGKWLSELDVFAIRLIADYTSIRETWKEQD